MNKHGYTIVTGGASGIGMSIVYKLKKRNLLVIDKDEIGLKKLHDKCKNILTFNIDLTDTEKLKAFIKHIHDNNYIINALINSAGSQEHIGILELDIENWNNMFKVNLDAAFLLSQAVSLNMIQNQTKGCIINVSSIHSSIIRNIVHYSTSKAALDMLTKELAYKLSEYGIRAISIAPGSIDTPLLRKDLNSKELRVHSSKKIPLGRLGTPNEVADLMCFLLSEKASYITGTVITIDGGLSLLI